MRTVLLSLALSLLGNLALGASLLARPPTTGDRVSPEHVSATGGASSSAPAWEVDERAVRRLALAELEERELGAIDNPWDRFWQPADPALQYALAVRAAYDRIRAELDRRFGGDAARAPELARAFRPLDAEARFLSSDEQLELQRRRLDARTAPGGRAVGSMPGAELSSPTLDFLSPAAAFELRLRSSPLAGLLRSSGASLDEHEFRAVLKLLESVGERAQLRSQLALRRELHDLLGADRATAVLAVRDPLWPLVQRVAAEQGLDASAAVAAYAAASEAQAALLELVTAAPLDAGGAAQASAIADAERTRLVAALGEKGAAAFIAARDALRPGAPH